MLNKILLWSKIARIIVDLSERLEVTPERAMEIFYESRVNDLIRDPDAGLYLYGDAYIVDEIMRELQAKQG